MPNEGDCSLSLLAEGLRGSPRAPSPERARALAAAALRPAPTVSVGPIIEHLERLVGALVEASAAPDAPLAADADSVRELTFALASTLGTARLEASEEEAVWQIAADLWNASVTVAGAPGLQKASELLHDLGAELLEVVGCEAGGARDAGLHVQFLCRMAREWDRLGCPNRAQWCVTRAVGYARGLEEAAAAPGAPVAARQRAALRLFDLYLQAAAHSMRSGQQLLANNMLAKALALSRDGGAAPGARAAMALGMAELQLERAAALLGDNPQGSASTALVLLASAEEHVAGAAAAAGEAAADGDDDGGELAQRAERMREEVLLAAARAHMEAGDPGAAVKKMEALGPGAAFLPAGALLAAAHVAAGAPSKTAAVLREAAAGGRLLLESSEAAAAWVEGFSAALGAAGPDAVPALTYAAFAYLAAVNGAQARVEPLLRCLLAGEGAAALGVAMAVLASEAMSAAAAAAPELKKYCHSMLRALAAQHLGEGHPAAAVALLTAALQYAPPSLRSKTAAMLAALQLRMGDHQKALDYIGQAEKAGGAGGRGPAPAASPLSSLAGLVRLCAELEITDASDLIKKVRKLANCPDFHAGVAAAAAQAARLHGAFAAEVEAAALAAAQVVPRDASPGAAAPGEEAAALTAWATALLRQAVRGGATAAEAPGAFVSLVDVFKLATKRLKTVGAARFGGGGSAAAVGRLARLGHRAAVGALLRGLHDCCVTMASSVCVLLDEQGGDGATADGKAAAAVGKARVLLLAVQALLETCVAVAASDGTRIPSPRLELAAKLAKKAARHATEGGAAAPSWLLPAALLLQLEVAASQGKQSALEAILVSLGAAQAALTAVQAGAVVRATAAASPAVKAAACDLLVGSAAHLPLGVLPEFFGLAQGAAQQLRACCAAAAAIAAADPAQARPDLRRWLAAAAADMGFACSASVPRSAVGILGVASAAAAEGGAAPPLQAQIREALEAAVAAAAHLPDDMDEEKGENPAANAGTQPSQQRGSAAAASPGARQAPLPAPQPPTVAPPSGGGSVSLQDRGGVSILYDTSGSEAEGSTAAAAAVAAVVTEEKVGEGDENRVEQLQVAFPVPAAGALAKHAPPAAPTPAVERPPAAAVPAVQRRHVGPKPAQRTGVSWFQALQAAQGKVAGAGGGSAQRFVPPRLQADLLTEANGPAQGVAPRPLPSLQQAEASVVPATATAAADTADALSLGSDAV